METPPVIRPRMDAERSPVSTVRHSTPSLENLANLELATPRMLRHTQSPDVVVLPQTQQSAHQFPHLAHHHAHIDSKGSPRYVAGPAHTPVVPANDTFRELKPLPIQPNLYAADVSKLVRQPAHPNLLPSPNVVPGVVPASTTHHKSLSLTHSGHTRSLGQNPLQNSHSRHPSQNLAPEKHSRSSSNHQNDPGFQHPPSEKSLAPQQFHRKSIGDWDFVKTIGAGSMGKVKLAQHNRTREMCAVKIVPRAAKLYQRAHSNDWPPLSPAEAQQRQKELDKEIARDKRTIREGALGRLLFHPYICRLYEMVPMTNHYYMLFELVEGGQMLDYIVAHGSLKERIARKFGRGIASALVYCHKNNVVHRDLKIENIMINSKGDIKIIDFGLSNLYSPKSQLKTYCGSLYFAAPELLCAKPYTGPEVDIWSFGVVLYVLLCGKVPFDDTSVPELHEKIKKGKVQYPDFLSSECVSLLSRMLVVDPLKRATLYEVCQHSWINRGYDLPVNSYLPPRTPLTLPLDPEIINTIAAFDLGTPSQITQDLTNILNSVPYQISCENWQNVTRLGREYDTASNARILADPTAGFHPLISIYYLVDEMRKRKVAKEEALRKQALASSQNPPLEPSLPSNAMNHPLQYPSPPVLRGDSPRNAVPALANDQRAPSNPERIPSPPTTSSRPRTPMKASAPFGGRASPRLPFPEPSHVSSISAAHERSGQSSPVPATSDSTSSVQVPPQQPLSPRLQASHDQDTERSPVKGFNSLLRRISTKKQGISSQVDATTPDLPSAQFDQGPQLPRAPHLVVTDTGNDKFQSPDSPGHSSMRRGTSMKVTANEKMTPTKPLSNVADRPNLPIQAPMAPIRGPGHSRSTSAHVFARTERPLPNTGAPPLPALGAAAVIALQRQNGLVDSSMGEQQRSLTAKASSAGHKMHPNARAKSMGDSMRRDPIYSGTRLEKPPLPDAMALQNSDDEAQGSRPPPQDSEAFFDEVTLDDVATKRLPYLTEDEIMSQFANTPPGSMPSIEHCKTLFLKGFFSVQTTSTKPLPVIRYNIIRVLSRLGVKYQEMKGGFVCEHTPSLQAHYELDAGETRLDSGGSHQAGQVSLDEMTDDAVLNTQKSQKSTLSSNDFDDDEATTPHKSTEQSPSSRTPRRRPSWNLASQAVSPSVNNAAFTKTHRVSNSVGGHRRKFSIGNSLLNTYRKRSDSLTAMPPNTPSAVRTGRELDEGEDDGGRQARQHSFDDSVDSLSGVNVGGGSDMLISSRIEHKARHQHSSSMVGAPAPRAKRSPLKFEIHIVRVPLVGMHGVQFKKLLGNTWNYKTLADQILYDMNL